MAELIDRSLPEPLYHQLERALRREIEGGVYEAGDLLPSEKEICDRFSVSRSVVRQTLQNLARAGLVHSERGRGTFVAETKLHERFVQRATGFYDDLTRMGYSIETQVIGQDRVELPLQVQDFLEVRRGIRIDRVRSVQGRLLAYVTTYLSEDRCPGLLEQDLTDRSLYDHLYRTYGLQVHSGRRTVEAVAAQDDVAERLQVAVGTPVLLLRSESRTADGRPFEWFDAWHRADRTMFEVEIVPGQPERTFNGVVRTGHRPAAATGNPGSQATRHTFDWGSQLGQALRQTRTVAVLRAPRYGDPPALAAGLRDGGVPIIEFTLTGANALEAIAAASSVPDVIVGAGSVLTAAQGLAAVDAGARFLVSPVGASEVVTAAGDVPVMLAGLTPDEVWHAWQTTGAPVKLFPASLWGPTYLASLLAPMPEVAIMPSGGVSADNVQEYLSAGAVAVNVGGALCPPELLEAGRGALLTDRARALREAVGSSAP